MLVRSAVVVLPNALTTLAGAPNRSSQYLVTSLAGSGRGPSSSVKTSDESISVAWPLAPSTHAVESDRRKATVIRCKGAEGDGSFATRLVVDDRTRPIGS